MTTESRYARRCTSTPVGSYRVASETTANKSYDLVIDEYGRNTCTCVAFAIKRNKLGGLDAIGTPECTCKHIRAMLETRGGCGWNSLTGETPEFETVCPRCYEDTEVYDPRDPEDVDLDELMADFLALSKKLKKLER